VRQIFAWYTRGDGGDPLTVTEISDRLNTDGTPARKGARWSPGTLYPLLRRETYAGTWHGYRYATGKRGGNNWRKRRPKSDWRAVPCPAIIHRDTWQAAQERLNGGRHAARWTAKHEYLLAGHTVCSCGYHASGHPCWANGKCYTYYRCNGALSRRNTKRDCETPGFRAATWDVIVWDYLHDLLMHPETLTKGMRAEQGRRRQKAARLEAAHTRATAKLAGYQTELDNLGRMLYKGQCTDAFHDREKALIERQRADVLAEQAKLADDLAALTLTDARIESLERYSAEAGEGLDAATFADMRHYLDCLEVTARLAVEDGEKVIYLRVNVMGKREHRLSQESGIP
jgi:hypothetical protein